MWLAALRSPRPLFQPVLHAVHAKSSHSMRGSWHAAAQNVLEHTFTLPSLCSVFFLTSMWPRIVLNLLIKPTRCIIFSILFLEWNSACFGQIVCPSSGVFHCTHSNGTRHTGLLTAYEQDRDGTELLWVVKKHNLGIYRPLGTAYRYILQGSLEECNDRLSQDVGKPPTKGAKTSSTQRRQPEISYGTFMLTLFTLLSA